MATLLIHSIECIAVSKSALTPEARAAINTTAHSVATVATSAGPYGAIVGAAIEAGRTIFYAIGDIGSGPDQLYLSVSNTPGIEKVWPLDRNVYEIVTGQIVRELNARYTTFGEATLWGPFSPLKDMPTIFPIAIFGPLKIEFKDVIDVNFWEGDSSSSDDFMGRLTANTGEIGRMKTQIVGNADEGAIYSVVYSVEAPSVEVPRWVPLVGGKINSDLAVLNTLDDQLVLFGKDMDNDLYWRSQMNNRWENTTWKRLGVPHEGMHGSPAVALDADGRIVVFVQGGDNEIWRKSQLYRNSDRWSEWASLGGSVTSSPAVVLDRNGCLVVFARGDGADKPVIHCWQTRRNSEWMADWTSIGGSIIGAPTAALDYDGYVVVTAQGLNGAVWMIKQTEKYHAPGINEALLAPGVIDMLAPRKLIAGKQKDLTSSSSFGGGTSTVEMNSDLPPRKPTHGRWRNGWTSLDRIVTSAPSITKDVNGWLVVFAKGTDTNPNNAVFHRYIDAQSNEWYPLFGTLISGVASTLTSDGRLVIFGVTDDNTVWSRFQTTRNGDWLTETQFVV